MVQVTYLRDSGYIVLLIRLFEFKLRKSYNVLAEAYHPYVKGNKLSVQVEYKLISLISRPL